MDCWNTSPLVARDSNYDHTAGQLLTDGTRGKAQLSPFCESRVEKSPWIALNMSSPARDAGVTNGTPSERKMVVAARWRLLRDALLGRPVSRKATFGGYDMIASRVLLCSVQEDGELGDRLEKGLTTIKVSVETMLHTELLDQLETSLLALLALQSQDDSIPIQKHSFLFSMKAKSDEIASTRLAVDWPTVATELVKRCGLDCCSIRFQASGSSPQLLMDIEMSSKNRYLIRRYEMGERVDTQPSDSQSFLLVRERSPEQVISLEELTSHHGAHEIDNTGNVCVWDCEKTLLWALLKSSDSSYGRVVELGAGMAGLAALGLGATGKANSLVITDGNLGSLQSNRTHVRLMEVVAPLDCTVDNLLLPWALEQSQEGDAFSHLNLEPANLSVVSDCAHFERFHGHLLWTLIQCTAVGGQVWMCHPNRGRSLERFLDVVRLFLSTAESKPEDDLLVLEEKRFPYLDEKHQDLTREDPEYRPNVHKPRIFALTKLRSATEKDRRSIAAHMAHRNKSNSKS